MFIANYKGGRNESFMYGYDDNVLIYDYDLTSAYTTVLYNIGQPDYRNLTKLTYDDLLLLTDKELLFSYTIIKGDFWYPVSSNVKYPSIPVYVDDTTTVYPLEGKCILTGAEYILARNQGCSIVAEEIYRIPFLTNVTDEVVSNIKE